MIPPLELSRIVSYKHETAKCSGAVQAERVRAISEQDALRERRIKNARGEGELDSFTRCRRGSGHGKKKYRQSSPLVEVGRETNELE